ncbi:MAG: FliA/WhiG family RNA polymerase sigma factor [bacterium]|nr:FliA/WhiG family RNA polymerase sigma factor [bacterium]
MKDTRVVGTAAKARKSVNVEQVWRDFKRTGDGGLRNTLIEHYLPLVRYIAERISAKLPQNTELDDLTSAGIFGLMDAVNGFDLARGVKFESYGTTRIRGAMLDELRELDWVPRIIRQKASRIDAAWKDLQIDLGRMPTDSEMAERFDINLGEYEDMVRQASAITVVSLSETVHQGTRSLARSDLVKDRRSVDPEDDLRRQEVTEFITSRLSRKEWLIVLLYYYEDLTMREIGAALDLSESRICQLHTRIILKLHRYLQPIRTDLLS